MGLDGMCCETQRTQHGRGPWQGNLDVQIVFESWLDSLLFLLFQGRAGPLCASCAQDYRASKRVCVECKNVSTEKTLSCKVKYWYTLLVA